MKPLLVAVMIVSGWVLSYANPEITVTLLGDATMDMVWIDPGTFTMGSPETELGRWRDEGPQHQVTISRGFWMGKYEITHEQWKAVMGTTPWAGQSEVQENPNYPAEYISWDDIEDFIHRLNVAAADSLYRLPTEAEWEYACRAGTTTRWSFGDDQNLLGEYAWYYDNILATGEWYFHAVGTKLPNPWGLYDMYGNVSEWCQDLFAFYTSDSQIDPSGPISATNSSAGYNHIHRGGTIGHQAEKQRSAARDNAYPDKHFGGLGGRLVRQVHQGPSLVTPNTWGQVKEQAP